MTKERGKLAYFPELHNIVHCFSNMQKIHLKNFRKIRELDLVKLESKFFLPLGGITELVRPGFSKILPINNEISIFVILLCLIMKVQRKQVYCCCLVVSVINTKDLMISIINPLIFSTI